MTKTPLTERQRYWLEHLQACESRAMRLSDYAREHELSLQALYNAKSQLKRRGAHDAPDTAVARAPRLVRVNIAEAGGAPSTSNTPCRVHFGNGTWIELSVEPNDLGALFRTVASS